MRCPKCSADNFTATRFCVECGWDMNKSPDRPTPEAADTTMAGPAGEFASAEPATSDHLMWVYQTGGRVSAAPLLADGIAYFGSHDRNMYALDIGTRTLKWSFGTDGKINASPALADGTLFFGCDDYSLYAIDAVTGEEKWYFTTGGDITATPLIAGSQVLFGSHDGTFYSLDAASGDENWRVPTGSRIVGDCSLADDLVFFTNKIGMILAVRITDGEIVHDIRDYQKPTAPTIAGGIVIFSTSDGLYGINAPTAAEAWAFKTVGRGIKQPIVAGGLVIFDSADYVFALDAATGHKRWQRLLESRLSQMLTAADDTLYILDQNHLLTGVSLKQGMKMMDFFTDCRNQYSRPVVDGNSMLLGCGDSLLGVEFGTAAPVAADTAPADSGASTSPVPEMAQIVAAGKVRSYTGVPGYSNAQATWHLYPLMILGGIWYQFFWFYRNWKYMDLTEDKDYRPGLRVIGLLSPIIYGSIMSFFVSVSLGDRLFFELYIGGIAALSILTLILMYDQIKTVRDHADAARVKSFSLFLIVTGFFSFRNLPYYLGQLWSIFFGEPETSTVVLLTLLGILSGVISVFFLTRVQRSNNELWVKQNPMAVIRKRFTRGEWALMIVFGGLQVFGLLVILAATV